ncbi:MAG: hypothetical protein FWG93_05305 [Oscillospiraceae bacterium]|nr:hypothetical protein [Oscillospiraceae bacterium]
MGADHTAAIKTDGSLWTWENQYGGWGSGGQSFLYPEPVQIGTDYNWESVSAGGAHSLAIKTDGSLWAWGRNSNGQLGDGTTTDRNEPVRIGTDNDWAGISPNGSVSTALKTDGSVWTWGKHHYSFDEMKLEPVRIGTDNDWTSISSGFILTAALKADGSLWCWKALDYDRSEVFLPRQLGTDTDWIHAAVGAGILAIRADGSLWAWLWTDDGSVESFDAERFDTDNDWISVVGNGEGNNRHATAALKADGSLWIFDYDYDWENGGATLQAAQLGTDTDWLSADVNWWGSTCMAIKEDGSMWVSVLDSEESEWDDEGQPIAWVEFWVAPRRIYPAPPVSTPQATPYPNVGVTLDGVKVPVEVYGINGNIYLRLSDLAIAVGINASWDGAVQLDTTKPAGSSTPGAMPTEPVEATLYPDIKVYLDGTEIPVNVYGISGSTILGLGDVARALNLNPSWENGTAVLTRAGS